MIKKGKNTHINEKDSQEKEEQLPATKDNLASSYKLRKTIIDN